MFFYFFGAILLIVGIAARVWVNRRRFYRRGPGGLQHFNTYSGSVLTTFTERLIRFIALLMIIVGVCALLYGHKLQTDPYYGSHPTIRHGH